jgi:glycosyltransferase involved in cell wall biosynthesis
MKPKKRVLIDVFYLYVAQTGIKTYTLSLCDEIGRNKNSEFEYIISPEFRKIVENRFFRGKTSKWKNILFQIMYFIRKQFVLPFLSYWHQTDLIFCPDILIPIFGKGKKVSVVYDTFFWDNPEHYNGIWLKYFLFFLKLGLKNNSSIVTVTEFSQNRLKDIGLFKNKTIHFAHPSSELINNSSNRPATKTAKSDSPLQNYFLHVGVLEKRKNLGLLIDAFALFIQNKEYSNYKLYLVGQRGPRETLDDYDYLMGKVKYLKIEEKVIFAGFVDLPSLISYFEKAKAYIFPSVNEGFGLPVLEAFSFGIPVIIANQGALREVAGDAALVITENTPASLLSSMIQLVGNQDLASALIEKGNERLKEFTPQKFFISLEAVFKKIMNE